MRGVITRKEILVYAVTIVRLFGAAGKAAQVTMSWSQPQPKQLWLSDTSERPVQKIDGPIDVPAWGLLTVRAER